MRGGVGVYLEKILHQITNKYPYIEIKEVKTDINHIHILAVIPPKYAVSDIVRIRKANTGKKMRDRFKPLDKVYWGIKGIWSIGYFVSTVEVDEKTVENYIKMQGQEDSG